MEATATYICTSLFVSLRHGLQFSKDLDEYKILMQENEKTILTKGQDALLRSHLHQLSQLLALRQEPLTSGMGEDKAVSLPPFDAVLVQGPTSTALDIQSSEMDVEAIQLIASLLRRWVKAQDPNLNVQYLDLLPMTLPRALSMKSQVNEEEASYMDNTHFSGNLLFALALRQLSAYYSLAH